MSLINEALKKAQRLRAEGQSGETAPPVSGAGGRVAKRGQARSSQTIVLIGSGAIVLVVLTVVITFWLINRPSAPSPQPVASTSAAPKSTPPAEIAPAVVAPVITPAPSVKPTAAPTQTPPPIEVKPAPAAADAPTETTGPAPAVAAASTPPPVATESATIPPPAGTPSHQAPAEAPATTSATPAPAPITPAPASPSVTPKSDERVAAFVDAIRVTAIRANDKKVIMNDRVYRVNDIVERTLGIKLIKVAPDSLTFADSNGVTYMKYF